MSKKLQLKINLKTIIFLVMALLIILIAIIAIINNENEEYALTGTNYNSDLSLDFLKFENNKKNIVYSPLSIKYALKMLYEGSSGNTRTQIENVIGNINLTKYDNIENVLSLANGIYIRDSFEKQVKESFKNTLIQKYNAEINYDSFENAQNINNWIENKTLGIIKNIISDDLVQRPSTNMLLINALAIDMVWNSPFNTSSTYGETFYLDDGNTIMATMMHKEETTSDNISFFKDKNITSLTMNFKKYDNTQLEFIAIMPNDNNLSKYIKDFKIDNLDKITKKSTLASETKYGVNISIPKFSFDYDLKLKEHLISLGITDAFDSSLADFSNISTTPTYVSEALHKATIDFAEESVKASAATIFTQETASIEFEIKEPEKIIIDKPFLYVIRDKSTHEIWFVGAVYEPNLWEENKAKYSYDLNDF